MDLHLLGQHLNGADTGHLMSLLDATDVSAARCQQHVFLDQAACRAQLLQRPTKVGLGWDTLSGRHSPDFRPMRLKRPRPSSLIGSLTRKNIQLLLEICF